MKTRKLLSLVAGIAMVASVFATAASAATVGPNENPVASVEVVNVTAAGLAIMDVKFDIDVEDFKAYEAILDEETYEEVFVGKGIQAIQVTFGLNDDIFDKSTTALISSATMKDATGAVKSDKSVDVTFAALTKGAWKLENNYTLCRVKANLDDKSITKDQLAAMQDLIDFSAFTVKTQAYPAAGAASEKDLEFETYYRLDGNGDYIPTVIEGAEVVEPEPPVVPEVKDFVLTEKTDADAAWEAETGKNAVYWGVKFAEGKFNNYSKAVFTAGEDVRERVFKAGNDFDVNGEVEFAIVVVAPEAITNIVTADIQ